MMSYAKSHTQRHTNALRAVKTSSGRIQVAKLPPGHDGACWAAHDVGAVDVFSMSLHWATGHLWAVSPVAKIIIPLENASAFFKKFRGILAWKSEKTSFCKEALILFQRLKQFFHLTRQFVHLRAVD